jgi:G3E family GTPase
MDRPDQSTTDHATGERMPISLVTGFLGSGKTTLISALLKQPAMAGTAIIVNEFGAVGIDDAIIAQSVGVDDVLLLANGCLCCTTGDDLAAKIWTFARRTAGRPQRIVVETTGLAEPAPILARLMSDPRLAQATRLDTVVATIDAVNGLDNLRHRPVATRQCAVADRRIITKADLADPEDVATLASRLRALNPGADIREAAHGRIDGGEVFGASLYDAASGRPDVDRWLGLSRHREESHHRHDHAAVCTWCFEEPLPVDWECLSSHIGALIAHHGERLLRIKGVIHTTGDSRPLVIHGVQRVFHPPVRLREWTRRPGTSIVAIGDEGAADVVGGIGDALAAAAQPEAARTRPGVSVRNQERMRR